MILTVTPNPSIDMLYQADTLVWDDANRVEMPRRRAGGQGINLTRAARALGGDSVAAAFFGGAAGQELQALLNQDATPHVIVPCAAETRTFVAVRELATGRSLLINPRGPVLDRADHDRMLEVVTRLCAELRPRCVVCSGSVPRGIGRELYAEISRAAHEHGARFIADCDGETLELAAREGCDLLAPNQHEAARLLGRRITSIGDAASAARSLLARAPRVLIKLGANGAVLAVDEDCWYAAGRELKSGSAVGAGDAFLAAFLVADHNGAAPPEALRRAVAAGGAVLLGHGTTLLDPADLDALLPEVKVTSCR